MNNNLTPEMLALIDGEQRLIQSQKSGFKKVKIEENDSWLIRYIPFEFGRKKSFFLRVANHWIMKKPHFCPRHSSEEVGGSPDAPCAICDVSSDMDSSSNQAIRKAGFRASATQQWLMYCWVFERDLAKKGEIELVEDANERWTPWEYWHNKWGFEEFLAIYRKCALRQHNPINVLDVLNGCNFWARSTQKGISLHREDSGPIAEASDEEIQAILDFTWPKIKVPTYTKLTDEQVDAALMKLEESARADTSARRNFRETEDSELSPQAPRGAAPKPLPSGARPVSRPGQAPSVRPPSVSSAPRHAPQPDAQDQPEQEAEVPRPKPVVAPPSVSVPRPPSVARQAAPSIRPSPAPVDMPDSEPEAVPPAKAPSLSERIRARSTSREPIAPPSEPARAVTSTLEEADNVTDETLDPAPPADVELDEAPPAVEATGQPASGAPRISQRLLAGIARASTRK